MTLTEALARLLAELGLGTLDGDPPTIYLTRMPDQPDTCLVVARYGGPESPLGDVHDEPGIQVRVRGPAADVRVAEDLAQRVYRALHGLGDRYLPGGEWWLQLMVGAQSGPTFIGQDGRGRPEYTVNFRADVARHEE